MPDHQQQQKTYWSNLEYPFQTTVFHATFYCKNNLRLTLQLTFTKRKASTENWVFKVASLLNVVEIDFPACIFDNWYSHTSHLLSQH